MRRYVDRIVWPGAPFDKYIISIGDEIKIPHNKDTYFIGLFLRLSYDEEINATDVLEVDFTEPTNLPGPRKVVHTITDLDRIPERTDADTLAFLINEINRRRSSSINDLYIYQAVYEGDKIVSYRRVSTDDGDISRVYQGVGYASIIRKDLDEVDLNDRFDEHYPYISNI